MKEAQIISKLKHQYLLELVAVSGDPLDTLVFPYYPNGNLYDFVLSEHVDARNFFADGVSLLSMCSKIAQGMVYLHENHIIHCDLKSPNVLLTCSLDPKVGVHFL
jgi:serine/threonine protein kinase